jgi:hypothetical protein
MPSRGGGGQLARFVFLRAAWRAIEEWREIDTVPGLAGTASEEAIALALRVATQAAFHTALRLIELIAAHLFLLAQPAGFSEQVVGADPDGFFGHFLSNWRGRRGALSDQVREAYLEPLRSPETIRAICDNHRANAVIDPDHDAVDRAAGVRLAMPVLAAWRSFPSQGTVPMRSSLRSAFSWVERPRL